MTTKPAVHVLLRGDDIDLLRRLARNEERPMTWIIRRALKAYEAQARTEVAR